MSRKRSFAIGVVILAAVFMLVCIALAVTLLLADNERARARTESIELSRRTYGRLQTGMTRTEVEQQIGGDAKKLYRCSWGVDVYLIGSPDPGRAAIMYLTFRDAGDGNQVLEKISGLDQDQLPQFASCQVSFQ